jgi:hypothetical protein
LHTYTYTYKSCTDARITRYNNSISAKFSAHSYTNLCVCVCVCICNTRRKHTFKLLKSISVSIKRGKRRLVQIVEIIFELIHWRWLKEGRSTKEKERDRALDGREVGECMKEETTLFRRTYGHYQLADFNYRIFIRHMYKWKNRPKIKIFMERNRIKLQSQDWWPRFVKIYACVICIIGSLR